VIAALDKTRPNLPEKPLPPKKTGVAVSVDDDMEPYKVVRSGGIKGASGKNAPKGKVSLRTFFVLSYVHHVYAQLHGNYYT
jgi:hypothetical protein